MDDRGRETERMKPKVLFVIDHLGVGGVQEFIFNYVKHSSHHEVTVVSLFGNDVYSQKIEREGGKTIFLSKLSYSYQNILNFKVFAHFKTFMQDHLHYFDAVHVKLFATFLYASLLKLYRYPQVSAGLDASKYQLPGALRLLYRIYANRYQKFYLPHFYWEEYRYLDRHRLINQTYFVSKRHSLTPIQYPHQFVLLSIGRCIEQKGFEEVIELFQTLQTLSTLDVGLYIIGDGPYKNKLMQKVCEQGIRNVYFTGNILNLDDYMESAHMVIKMAKKEGPNSVVREALVSGKWVASTLETQECQNLLEQELLIPIDSHHLQDSAQLIIEHLQKFGTSKPNPVLMSKAEALWSPKEIFENYQVK